MLKVGTEVSMNNGVREGLTIEEGFTRIAYIPVGNNVLSTSRLDYYWYSINETVATVSDYGTITALSAGTTRIRAVLKNNLSYAGDLTVTVTQATSRPLYEISLTTDDGNLRNLLGSMAQFTDVPKDVLYVNYSRAICIVMQNSLGEDISPVSIIKYFNWASSNSSIATIDEFGVITGVSQGSVIITGEYKFNEYYIGELSIEITVE